MKIRDRDSKGLLARKKFNDSRKSKYLLGGTNKGLKSHLKNIMMKLRKMQAKLLAIIINSFYFTAINP